MNDNDLKIILRASNDNLIRWVKRWKSIEPDTATFSAIVLEEAGESLKEVASAISFLLWSSIIATIVVVVFTFNNTMGVNGLLIVQIIFGFIALIAITGIIRGLKKAGNLLKNHM